MSERVDMNLVDALVHANFWNLVEETMTEPKRYTAKEAMHWMIDNQDRQMIHEDVTLSNRFYRWDGINFQTSMKGFAWVDIGEPVYREGSFHIASEYEAWQKAKEEKPEKSLLQYSCKIKEGEQVELSFDKLESWIKHYVQRELENFVRKEGR